MLQLKAYENILSRPDIHYFWFLDLFCLFTTLIGEGLVAILKENNNELIYASFESIGITSFSDVICTQHLGKFLFN